MPIKPNGKLTSAYFAALKKILDPDMKENLGWAKLGRSDIQPELGIGKDDAIAIMIEINSQLIKTAEAWYLLRPGHYERRNCPNTALLISMLNSNRPRIINFTDPKEFNLDKLKEEYGDDNLPAMCDVVNWCREFINGKNGAIKIEASVNYGGTYTPGDLIGRRGPDGVNHGGVNIPGKRK